MKILAVAILASLLCGCMTADDPEVLTTKPWENRYGTVEEFRQKTADIELEKGESVWVLSNKTLKRLLKSTGK